MAITPCALIVLISFISQQIPTLATRKIYNIRVIAHAKPAIYPTHFNWYSTELTQPGEMRQVYEQVYHGFSASLSPERVEELTAHAAVLQVSEDIVYQLHTTRSPEFIGLSNNNVFWPNTNYGSGMIIGILDTGIWPEHASFNCETPRRVPPKWKGECQTGEHFLQSLCNNKLIGARYFANGYRAFLRKNESTKTLEYNSSRDAQGHGTHTASTAAGCFVKGANLSGYAAGEAKGVAPNAHLAVYKVCWAIVGCFTSDILAALESAVKDGVHVISMSLGSDGHIPPSLDIIAIASFAAISKGISVVSSAGNDGPGSFSLSNEAPWEFLVGASSIDRNFPAVAMLGNRSNLTGISLDSGSLFNNHVYRLVFPGISDASSGSANCLDGYLDADLVRGNVVVCVRGGPRLEKGYVVKKLGGRGMILINSELQGEELVADYHVLPAIALGFRAGQMLSDYVKSNVKANVSIRFLGTAMNFKPAPVVSSFSSRGPSLYSPQILKPDIVAPGLNILAAWPPVVSLTEIDIDKRRSSFNIESGTSMSCPHVSGAVALLMSARPIWSPAAVRSAMMTTANVHDNDGHLVVDSFSGKAASPFALGSGNINLRKANDPGLVYDIAPNDYVLMYCSLYNQSVVRQVFGGHANCSAKMPPENLNYPAFSAVFSSSRSTSGTVKKVFLRTVTNVGAAGSVYHAKIVFPVGVLVRVDPPLLVFNNTTTRKTFVVTIELNTTLLQDLDSSSKIIHGSLAWFNSLHTVRSPIVVFSMS